MKYAFIALIAIYLIIYGCSPDSSEKAKKSHDQAVQTTAQESHGGEKAAVAVQHQQPAAAVQHDDKTDAQKKTDQTQPNIETPVVIMAQPVVTEQKPAKVAESEQVVLPCGRVIARTDAADNAPPCLKMQPPETLDKAAITGTEQELTAALQNMVKTTNEMVLATKQLVSATQEILKASSKAADKPQPAKQSPVAGEEAAPAPQ